MPRSHSTISVYEHHTLRLGDKFGKGDNTVTFDLAALEAFQRHYGHKGVTYYTLVHNGIRFNQYVGVIQAGNTIVEVLPKADKVDLGSGDQQKQWRDVLINMLLTVGPFQVQSPGNSTLRLKPNNLLDLYFALFLHEVEHLMHCGLIKKYRTTEGNTTALKGSLHFPRHIRENLTHHERFYVRHTTYDTRHQLHAILAKTLRLLKTINTHAPLNSRIGALMLNFPEMPDIHVTDATFTRIRYDRKTQPYKNALSIARLLLLNYHPDVRSGRNDVLALMFDMNQLWEQFVYISLRRNCQPGETVRCQQSRNFWQHQEGRITRIRPDIVVTGSGGNTVVLDTKWKNPGDFNPTTDDLRQMYVYHQYYNADDVALIYPGNQPRSVQGNYITTGTTQQKDRMKCHIFTLAVHSGNVRRWQETIYNQFKDKFNPL